jgi:putative ABC transport system permease protein
VSTFSLALRNLLRNRRRSLTTLLAMVIGAVCILLFGGYSRNINTGLQTNFVRSGGHLQIQHEDYFLYGAGDPLDYGIADYERVIEVVKSDPVLAPMLTVVTPILQVGGLAGNYAAGVSRTVLAHGSVIEDQNRMREWNDYGFPGSKQLLALTGTAADAAVVGRGLARVLQVCAPLHVSNCRGPRPTERNSAASLPDDIAALKPTAEGRPADGRPLSSTPQVQLLAATAHGAPNVADLTVVKAEEQGIKELDDMYVGMHLSEAQRLIYGGGPAEVTAIELQLKHTDQIPAARARLKQLLAGPLRGEQLEIQDFATLNPFYGQVLALFAAIFGFIAILIGAIVLFTVGNTMSMAVVERTVEIGTLRALGVRRSAIRRLFLCEGFLLGVLGAALGVAVALFLAYLINHSGLTWIPPGRVDPVPLNVSIWGETRLIVGTTIGLLCVAVASAWWPAGRAAGLNVVEALRHV